MIWPYVIFIYVLTSLLLGLLFHLAACFDNPVRPKRAELVVFFVVFSMLGIPLVMANLLFTSFPASTGSRGAKGLLAKEISPS